VPSAKTSRVATLTSRTAADLAIIERTLLTDSTVTTVSKRIAGFASERCTTTYSAGSRVGRSVPVHSFVTN
jgi:hypothetical protein